MRESLFNTRQWLAGLQIKLLERAAKKKLVVITKNEEMEMWGTYIHAKNN